MRFWKTKSGVVVTLTAAVLVAGGGWLAFKPDHKSTTSTQTANPVSTSTGTGQSTSSSNSSGVAVVETADFKYEIPSGWIQMKKEVLDQIGATSGIGRLSSSTAIFKTSVSSSTPKDNNELKNSTLDDIKKNAPHFALISSESTKVSNQAGQVFIYTFTDSAGQNKLRQQLSAVPYKGKTFFLVASSTDPDFANQTGEFKAILSSFKFK